MAKLSKKEQLIFKKYRIKAEQDLIQKVKQVEKILIQLPDYQGTGYLQKKLKQRIAQNFYNFRNSKAGMSNPELFKAVMKHQNKMRRIFGQRPVSPKIAKPKVITTAMKTRQKLQQQYYYYLKQFYQKSKQEAETLVGGIRIKGRNYKAGKTVQNVKARLRNSAKTNLDYQEAINYLKNQQALMLRKKYSYLAENVRANEIAKLYEEQVNLWFVNNSEQAQRLTEEYGIDWMRDWSLKRVALSIADNENVFEELARRYNIKKEIIERAFENYRYRYAKV